MGSREEPKSMRDNKPPTAASRGSPDEGVRSTHHAMRQPTSASVRSCGAWSKPSFHSGARIPPGYCWSTPKCRNLGVQDAVFEGKKAEETAPRKSTPRTLKEDDQQYPPV